MINKSALEALLIKKDKEKNLKSGIMFLSYCSIFFLCGTR
jgi:hypothetical protein